MCILAMRFQLFRGPPRGGLDTIYQSGENTIGPPSKSSCALIALICVYMCYYVCICVYMCVNECMCVNMCVCVCVYVCVYVCIYV